MTIEELAELTDALGGKDPTGEGRDGVAVLNLFRVPPPEVIEVPHANEGERHRGDDEQQQVDVAPAGQEAAGQQHLLRGPQHHEREEMLLVQRGRERDRDDAADGARRAEPQQPGPLFSDGRCRHLMGT
jgi:hypothetical protein